ncbi:hypothetical protein ACJ41O_011659 [Fusarium nematophilum]
MPSSVKSWFARHCAPPPPLNNSSVCPCSSCFNGGSHANNSASFVVYTPPKPAEPRRTESDASSLSSATTITTSTHIENAKR